MTIRMTFLSLFALISFAAGAVFHPPLARAETQGYQVAESGGLQKGGHHPGRGFLRKGQGQDGAAAGSGTMKERREALKEKLMQLPPEQRKAKIQELKQTMAQQREQQLSQRKQEFENRWDKATPEQRTKFCSNVQQKCSDGGDGQFACKVAQAKCTGQ